MSKHQSRKSISVSGVTYDRLKEYCLSNNLSLSHFCETIICDKLGVEPGVKTARKSNLRPTPPKAAESQVEAVEADDSTSIELSSTERRAMVLAQADHRLRMSGRDVEPPPGQKRVNKAPKPSIVDRLGRRPQKVVRHDPKPANSDI